MHKLDGLGIKNSHVLRLYVVDVAIMLKERPGGDGGDDRPNILAGLITGLVRLFGSLTITTVIALGGTRQLASWNLLGWASLLMAGAGAYVGAHWGLEGVIYGVACGTMVRVLASLPMMLPHLRGRRPPDVT